MPQLNGRKFSFMFQIVLGMPPKSQQEHSKDHQTNNPPRMAILRIPYRQNLGRAPNGSGGPTDFQQELGQKDLAKGSIINGFQLEVLGSMHAPAISKAGVTVVSAPTKVDGQGRVFLLHHHGGSVVVVVGGGREKAVPRCRSIPRIHGRALAASFFGVTTIADFVSFPILKSKRWSVL
jgi:hypothetical protein